MPFVDFDGAKIHYELEGDGGNITLLHGIAASLKYWCLQRELLSKRSRTILVDLRGHGLSDGMIKKKRLTVPELASSVRAVLHALNVEKTVMMGHSLGGITALQYTLDSPSEVDALILVDTASGMGSMTPQGKRLAQRLGAMRIAAFPSRTVRKSLLKNFLLGSEANQEVLNWILDWADSVNWSATARILRGLRGFDLSDRLAEIGCPTLIVCGREDKLAPLRMSEFMHERIGDSELKVIDGAGHCPSAEKPEEFNRTITEFLDRL